MEVEVLVSDEETEVLGKAALARACVDLNELAVTVRGELPPKHITQVRLGKVNSNLAS